MTQISRDEWLKALEDVGVMQHNYPDAVTITEFCELMSLKWATASRQLEALVTAGRATKVRKLSVSRDGRQMFRVAYMLEKVKK